MIKNRTHNNYILVDGHNDTMTKVVDKDTWLPIIDIGKSTNLHIDIPKLKEGGVNVAFFASYNSGYNGDSSKALSSNLSLINALYYTAKRNPDTFQLATSVNQILKILKDNKIAGISTIEGAYAIDDSNYVELLKQYYDLGIRVIGPTWNYSNSIGEGCSKVYGDEKRTPSCGGLTELGERVIKEMNKLGILIDVSHLSEDTFWDIIKISKSPVIASHSGVYNLRNHERNLKDDQLKAIKENGGVVGVVLFPNFLSGKKEVYIKDFVDHIDYIVNLIGVDHVGIGSDFDGAEIPLVLKDASEMYKITDELIKRAYNENEIEKILGKNILRIFDEGGLDEASKSPSSRFSIEYSDEIISIRFEDENIEIKGIKLIFDGIVYKTTITEPSTISFNIKEGLKEDFHVITFEKDNARYTELLHRGDFKKIL